MAINTVGFLTFCKSEKTPKKIAKSLRNAVKDMV